MAKFKVDFQELRKSFDIGFKDSEGFAVEFTDNEGFEVEFGQITVVSSDIGETYILEDENGNEVVGVLVSNETVFDATANDIRLGKTAATERGVTLGEKVIPSCYTTEGYKIIPVGGGVQLRTATFDYTKLQALICEFNTNLLNSVATEKVAINNNVYKVQSVDSLSVIIKDEVENSINFGIINDSDKPQILRYFYYKEIY